MRLLERTAATAPGSSSQTSFGPSVSRRTAAPTAGFQHNGAAQGSAPERSISRHKCYPPILPSGSTPCSGMPEMEQHPYSGVPEMECASLAAIPEDGTDVSVGSLQAKGAALQDWDREQQGRCPQPPPCQRAEEERSALQSLLEPEVGGLQILVGRGKSAWGAEAVGLDDNALRKAVIDVCGSVWVRPCLALRAGGRWSTRPDLMLACDRVMSCFSVCNGSFFRKK